MKPLLDRLAQPVVPHLRELWADEDHVIVRWDQDTPTRDGQRYRNSYAWFLKMKDARITEVTAFLDLPAYGALVSGAGRRGGS